MSKQTAKGEKASACPICKKPASPTHKPFCSKRCADIDLGRWLKGSYVINGRDGEAMSETLDHGEARQDQDAD